MLGAGYHFSARFFIRKTKQNKDLSENEIFPKCGRQIFDCLEAASAQKSQVGRDLNDVAGARGHGRGEDNVESDGVRTPMHGETEEERRSAATWHNGLSEIVEGQIVPWFGLAARIMHAVGGKGSGRRQQLCARGWREVGGHRQKVRDGKRGT